METQQPHWVLGSQDSDNDQNQVKDETGNPKDSEHVLPSLKTPSDGKRKCEGRVSPGSLWFQGDLPSLGDPARRRQRM